MFVSDGAVVEPPAAAESPLPAPPAQLVPPILPVQLEQPVQPEEIPQSPPPTGTTPAPPEVPAPAPTSPPEEGTISLSAQQIRNANSSIKKKFLYSFADKNSDADSGDAKADTPAEA